MTRAAIVSRLEAALTTGKLGQISGGGTWLDRDEFDVEIATEDAENAVAVIEEIISGLDGVEITSAVEIE